MNNKEIAQLLDQAALKAEAVEQISKEHEFTEAEAYEIQALSMEERYERDDDFAGLKLGFTSFAKMEQMGVHDMIWGRLTQNMWIENKGSINLSKFIHPRAEPEIAFKLKKDLDREISLEEISDYIESCCPAIEIIDSRYKNFKFSLEDVIADNCSSAGFVLGKWHPLPASLNDLRMSLSFDGIVVESDQSNAILDNPYLSVCNASRLAVKYNQAFPKGSILLAGAATPAVFIKPNSTVTAEVESLGSVSIKVKS
ncbi:MAG: 2-oxo-3-hexenedioate decarboxylase [Bacteroidia bacterium]|jgi:2-oxo-3-hexenedioate decarboxylase